MADELIGTPGVKPLSIVEVLNTISDGGALERLRDDLQQVARAVDATGKDGSASMAIKVKKLASGQVQIVAEVKSSVPRASQDPSIFFVADEDGALTRDNPRQGRLIG